MKKKMRVISCIIAIAFFVAGLTMNFVQPQNVTTVFSENAITSAVHQYTRQELQDHKITLRSDVMTVTERGIARKPTTLMDDTFTLEGQTVTFPSYPSFYEPYNILEDYTATGHFNYYKYMLLRQGILTIQDCVNASYNGTLSQENLKKHPAIDKQNGAILGDSNAVEKVIIIDPTYKSYHTTGLYLPPGEVVEVTIEDLGAGESINLVTNINLSLGYSTGSTYFADNDALVREGRFDEITLHSQWNRLNNRLPIMGANFTFDENKKYLVGTPFGGIMHLNVKNTSSRVKITIRGAVETPHFILGTTTVDYFEEYLRDAPGVLSCLDVENGLLVGNDAPFRTIDDVENIALLWHSFFSVNETYTGGQFNANNLVKFDTFVPAGGAVYLGGGVSCCPISWYKGCLNYQTLLRGGAWGVLHEIGHGNASSYGVIWGLAGARDGEVRNNALTVLCYIKFLDLGTSRSGEHGEFAHGYRTLSQYMNAVMSDEFTDFDEYGYFQALSAYANIMHSFGADKFFEVLNSYKDNPTYNDNKRADFIYRCSLVYNRDFRWYFNTMYKCNVQNSAFTTEQLEYLNSLIPYYPIASYYSGGLNGIKTSGDIIIPLYTDYTFNFIENTISPKNFVITKVNRPKYGKLALNEDGTYTYKCTNTTSPTDELSYEVRQENGEVQTINIYIRLNANFAQVSTYQALSDTKNGTVDINDLDLNIANVNMSPKATPEISSVAGVSKYSGRAMKVVDFIYYGETTREHTFYIKGDDKVACYVSFNGSEYKEVGRMTSYTNSYKDINSFTLSLKKDQKVYFRLYNLNQGGDGNANLGLKSTSGSVSNLSAFYNPSVSEEENLTFKNYVKPQTYMVSNKGTYTDAFATNKSEWEVIETPNHQGGNTYTEQEYDEEGNAIDGALIVKDKKDWIIDGYDSTYWHSVWSGSNRTPLPHEFVIDTKKVQDFNYFTMSTRNRQDSLIKQYSLAISDDNVNYKIIKDEDELKYTNYVANLTFPMVSGRFIKLTAYTTTGISNGQYYTIIKEINAGVSGSAEKMLSATSNNVSKSDGYFVSVDRTDLPNGYLATTKKNESIKFAFSGDKFCVYALKGENFGSAKVLVDGEEKGVISLNGTSGLRQLVYNIENLDDTEHLVEIVTLEDKLFSIDFIGVTNEAKLLQFEQNTSMNYVFIAILVLSAIVLLLFGICSMFLRKDRL